MLFAKEHHLALEQRVAQQSGELCRGRYPQINVVHHRAERQPQMLKLDASSIGPLLQQIRHRLVAHTFIFQVDTKRGAIKRQQEIVERIGVGHG